MQLYLVQHGASKSETEDPQRALTDEGRRVVEYMAQYLAAVVIGIDRIEHSEKLRARQTAEILAAALQPREGTKQVSGLAPNDDIEPERERLQTAANNLMLVGHLPYLSRLVATLLGLERDRAVSSSAWAVSSDSIEMKAASGLFTGGDSGPASVLGSKAGSCLSCERCYKQGKLLIAMRPTSVWTLATSSTLEWNWTLVDCIAKAALKRAA